MSRSTKLLRAVDVLTITTHHGKPRKNGVQPLHTSAYVVTRIDTDGKVAKHPAWRLTKLTHEGIEYDVHTDEFGTRCTCQDFISRRENTPEPCKHALSLKAHGLI